MMKIVALMAVLAVTQGADKFYFNSKKCNNDFDNPRNWVGKTIPGEMAVSVMFTSPDGEETRPIKTLIPDDTAFVATEVVLSDDMVIEFGDAVEITLSEAEEGVEAEAAWFTGGQDYNIDCDFSCHKNWQLKDGSEAPRPVCSGDIAIFDPSHSVVIFNSKDMNVEEMWFGPEVVENKINIPEYWFATNNPDAYYNTEQCRAKGHVNNIGGCICTTSCPGSLEEHAAASKLIRDAGKVKAEADLEAREEEVVVEFQATLPASLVDLSGCPTCPSWIDAVECVLGTDAAVVGLEASIRSKLDGFFTNYVVKFDSWDVVKDAAVVKGSFTAPKKAFWVGAPEEDGSTMWWKDTATFAIAPVNNRFYNAIWTGFINPAKACQNNQIEEQVQALNDQCDDASCGLCSLVEKLQPALADPTTISQVFSGDVDVLSDDVEAYLGFAEEVTNATKDELVDAFVQWYDECIDVPTMDPNATTAENATTPEPINVADLVDDFVQAKEAQAAAQEAFKEVTAPAPKLVAVDMSITPVGANLPADDLNFLVDDNNKEDLQFALQFQLEQEVFFDTVDKVEVALSDVARRRRALIDPDAAPKEMSVDLAGSGYGDFSPGSPIYNDIVALVSDIVASFDIETHHKCFSLDAGTDPDCLAEEVKAAVKAALAANPDLTAEEIAQVAIEAAKEVVGCGVQGPDPDTGACKNPDAAAEVISGDVVGAAITAASAEAKDEFDAEQAALNQGTDKTGGVGIVPIAAGAGAGLLIIIVIIVVVVMKKKDSSGGGGPAPKAASTSDRTVVAFENPMYDDPGSSPAAVYDNGPEAVDDGLYDEPAFSKQEEKANPMYQSNEDIAGMEAEEEGGYLDVAPEDEVGLDE